ncbi:mRNA interferase RelE/StbE [Gammaproteobacteria bacterium]
MNSIWKIEFDPRARAEFASLDRTIQKHIVKFIEQLKHDPRRHGASLRGETLGDYWKYRVGDYRLVADIRDKNFVVLIIAIGHRSDVYR